MSASTSRNWPRFGQSSGNGLVDGRPQVELGFDGAEDLLRAWRDGLTPDPDLTVALSSLGTWCGGMPRPKRW